MEQKNFKVSQQLKHISDITYLEESTNMHFIFKGIVLVVALLIVFTIWAAFVSISETTVTYGELVPENEIPLVQHLEGGIIEKIYVKEGAMVKKGDVLLKLKTKELESELEELRSSEVAYILEVERLTAFLDNKPADPEAWAQKVISSNYNLIDQKSEIQDLINRQVELLNAEYAQLADQKSVLNNLYVQRSEQLKEYLDKKKIWETHMTLLNQEFDMYKKLKNTNYISGRDYLSIIRSVNQAKGEGAQLDSQAEQTRESMKEAENKIKEAESTAREKALTELSKNKSSVMEIYYKIVKGTQQIERSTIRAPLDGIVKGLSLVEGEVVKAGQELLQVVPDGGILIAKTKILPREVGYLKIGNPVKVKVLTFDYARFGSIDGTLKSISASTFLDPEGNPYYKSKISLAEQSMLVNGVKKPFKAGMTVEGDIITGSKTLLEYLLKPIHRAVTESFHER